MKHEKKTWERIDRRLLQKTRVFDVYAQRMRSPDGSYEDDFYFLETTDWVNVLPVTADREIVLVRQFRHGVQSPCLEIPGGMLDAADEDPAQAARRELEEETGYTARAIERLGFVHPNPAIQSNTCHFYLAHDVVRTKEQCLDPAEDIDVAVVPLRDVTRLISSGEISHCLTVSALCQYLIRNGATF